MKNNNIWGLPQEHNFIPLPDKLNTPVKLRLKGECHGFIYVAENLGLYKIGYTRNLEARLRNIQTNSASPITIITAYHVDNMLNEERILKARFKDKCAHGEWFRLTEEDQNFIQTRKDGFKCSYLNF